MIFKVPLTFSWDLWESILDDMGVEDQDERDALADICYIEDYDLEIDSETGNLIRVNDMDVE